VSHYRSFIISIYSFTNLHYA